MSLTSEHVSKFRDSLRLADPTVVNDPAYTYSDEALRDVLTNAITLHDASFDENTIPSNRMGMVFLLARREIFYRLALSSAPYYPLAAEGAEIHKDVRFNHYLALIKQSESDYLDAYNLFEETNPDGITVGDVLIRQKRGTRRTYLLSKSPELSLQSVVASDHIDLDWTEYSSITGVFAFYEVYVGTELIYDRYAQPVTGLCYPIRDFELSPSAEKKAEIRDIKRTYFRVTGLAPNTKYHVLVVSTDTRYLRSFVEVELTTAAA